MSKRSEAIEVARQLDLEGCEFSAIVGMLVKRLGLQPDAARGVAAKVCQPAPRRRRGIAA